MDLDDWFKREVVSFLVLTPTSNSPQPVHVLNGLFHALLSGKRSARAAIDFVAPKKGGAWAVGTTALRERSTLKLPRDDARLEKARRSVSALIAADGAVYGDGFASFQLANLGLVTSDKTHHHLGDLAAQVLTASPEGCRAVGELVARLRMPQPNPHWSVEAAFVDLANVNRWEVEPPQRGSWWGMDSRCEGLARELNALMVRATRLCASGVDTLIGLQTLAAAATWVGLIVYAQVPQLCSGKPLATLLPEAGAPGALATVRAASVSVLDTLDGNFQEWLCSLLRDEVRSRVGSQDIEPLDVFRVLADVKAKTKMSGGTSRSPQDLAAMYRVWAIDHEPLDALARTLQESVQDSMGNKARDWFAAVGRHCGFVGPRRGKPARLRVEVALVPALILAGLSEDDGETVPFSTWLARMAARYGVVFGPNHLTRSMSPRPSDEELRQNQLDLAGLFSSLGLARLYNDSVTEILNPFYVWARQ
ncbi:hypothetical protein [Micromonospora sp. MA102]|uniref:hypothetical protein n=1 Tax=Micromonospora sp. MA102 TaxID=2952755 RepID=UPI0021C796CC|nr:hypothetical protein [Micromonospora sp. MA102]